MEKGRWYHIKITYTIQTDGSNHYLLPSFEGDLDVDSRGIVGTQGFQDYIYLPENFFCIKTIAAKCTIKGTMPTDSDSTKAGAHSGVVNFSRTFFSSSDRSFLASGFHFGQIYYFTYSTMSDPDNFGYMDTVDEYIFGYFLDM